jgi:hypothetical protein
MMERRWDGRVPVARIIFAVAVCLISASPPGTAVAADLHQVTLVMLDFKFEPTTIQLKAGEEAELTIRNTGKRPHEFLAGSGLLNGPDGKGYEKDLLAILEPKITGRDYGLVRAGLASKTVIPRLSSGLWIEPGGEAVLRFTVPAGVRGEWHMGCFTVRCVR